MSKAKAATARALMLAAAGLAGVAPFLSSQAPAAAYIPAQSDFLCDFPEDLSFYNFKRWFSYELPLKVYVPPLKLAVPAGSNYPRLLMHAFSSWGAAMPELKFQFVSDAKQASLVVKWTMVLPESEADRGAALYPQPNLKTARITHKAELLVPLKTAAGPGLPDENGNPPPAVYLSPAEFQGIALHNLGHSLGLTHSKDLNDLMSANFFGRLAAQSKWTLSPSDVATLRRLYTLPVRLEGPPCNGRD